MNRKQNNVLRMTSATLTLLEDHKELWEGFTVFSEQKSEIEKYKDECLTHKERQGEGNTVAVTAQKNQLLAEAVSISYKTALKAKVLALKTGDNALMEKVNFSKSEIEDGSDQETLDTIASILAGAEVYETMLIEQYNLKEGKLAALNKKIEQINDLLDNRTTSAATGKVSTANLSEAISELRSAWDSMDLLVEGMLEDEDFIETYKATRVIVK